MREGEWRYEVREGEMFGVQERELVLLVEHDSLMEERAFDVPDDVSVKLHMD